MTIFFGHANMRTLPPKIPEDAHLISYSCSVSRLLVLILQPTSYMANLDPSPFPCHVLRILNSLPPHSFRASILHSTLPSKMNPSSALEGVHGVHMELRSPFAVEEVSQSGDLVHSTCHNSASRASHQLLMPQLWQQIPACLRPMRTSCHGDHSIIETVANVLTSLPFIALGIQTPRKNLNSKLYANSLIGVGVASSLYHSSRGELRKYLRWADYTMIATAAVCLSRALRSENPKMLMAASALLVPVQPFMVSAIHTGMMEVAFAKRALYEPELRMAHNVHKMSSLLGGVLYIADDIFPRTPYIHAAWHLAAAVCVGSCNKLLE